MSFEKESQQSEKAGRSQLDLHAAEFSVVCLM